MDAISKNHDSKIIHGQYIFVLTFYFFNIVYILTLESNLFFLFFYVRLQGITKEAFVIDVIQYMLNIVNHLLFIQQKL
jgi:hypothetical protein